MNNVFVATGVSTDVESIFVQCFTHEPTKRELFNLAHEWCPVEDMSGAGYGGSNVIVMVVECDVRENRKVQEKKIRKLTTLEVSIEDLIDNSSVLILRNNSNGKLFAVPSFHPKITAENILSELEAEEYNDEFTISKHLWHSFRKYGEHWFNFTQLLTGNPHGRTQKYISENQLNRSDYGYNHN